MTSKQAFHYWITRDPSTYYTLDTILLTLVNSARLQDLCPTTVSTILVRLGNIRISEVN